jgi:predicted kinase
MAPTPLFAITGQLAAGKTTLPRAVLARFPFGFHIDVDGIREMVSPGLASPIEWTEETSRQFDLAVAASVALAAVYVEAGFAVAIEGAIDPFAVERHVAAAGMRDRLVGVVLHPPVDVARQRNRDRQTKTFEARSPSRRRSSD